MDDRNGNLYPSKEVAEVAGVPKEHIQEIEVLGNNFVKVISGPFKGRVYRKTATGLQRVS